MTGNSQQDYGKLQMATAQLIKENMTLTKEKRFLIILNHSARELLQIMATIQFMLDDHNKPNPEAEQLNITLHTTWNAIMQQISEVSIYLKGDEDVLRAYSEARAEYLKSTMNIESLDMYTEIDVALEKT